MIIILSILVALATIYFVAFLINKQVDFIVLIFQIVTTIYDLVTLPIYLFIDKPWKKKRFSQTPYSDRVYEPNGDYSYWQLKPEMLSSKHNAEHTDLENELKKVKHISELLPIAQVFHANKKSLGTRKVMRKVMDNGRAKFELSDYEWINFRDVQKTIDNLAKVFYHKFHFKHGDRVAIMADTSFEWLTSFFALQCLGCEVVTLHSTLGESGIAFILNSTKVEYLFTQTDLVHLLNKLKPKIETVKTLINFKNPYVDELTEEERSQTQYQLYEFNKLLEESKDLPDLDSNHNSNFSIDDVAIIMFTSGSTGDPKGVLITHHNILASSNGVLDRVHYSFKLTNDDTFLAYLPMSHIFEMMCEITFYVFGVKIAFGRATTLIKGAPLLSDNCLGDVQASKLSIWTGVPLVFERVQSRITMLLKSKSPYVAGAFNWAYEYKKKWTSRGYKCRFTDMVFFNFIKNQFGGRLRLIVAGGAPLMLETQIFLKMHFNIVLILGYSSTECTANGFLSMLDVFDHADTTAPMDGVKLRLDDWVDGGYHVNDKPNPRGEIILGTDATAIGYYENEDESKKAFFEQNGTRWWRSGDIGEMNEYGHLRIIDRKKDLVKLQMGEYIALGKAEAVLKNCMYLDNIVLHGSSFHNHLVAICQSNRESILKYGESIGLEEDYEKLIENPKIKTAVLDELTRFGKSNGLLSKEVPFVIKIVSDAWTPINGLLTPSLKVKRAQIYEFYKESIEQMYKELRAKFSASK